MTRRRRPPKRYRWWMAAGVAVIVVGGVGIGYLTTSNVSEKGHFPVTGNSPISASSPDTHTLEPSSPTPTRPSTRPSVTPSTATVRPRATATRPRASISSSPHPRPVWTPAPTPSSPHPRTTVTLTPAPAPTTTRRSLSLLDRVNGQRSAPLARYTGMDAAAQEMADSHAPCSAGPYAQVVCGYGDPAPNMLNPAFTKVGIGVNGGYTVVFLNY